MPDGSRLLNPDALILSAASPWSCGAAMNAMGLTIASNTWPTANKALYVPVSVQVPVIIAKMGVMNGTAVSGNIDVGIFDGMGKRLVSKGSTAQAGTSAVQEFDITDTTLWPGLYYLACVLDNTTGTLEMWNPSSAIGRALGVCEQTSAFALPTTATFAALSAARIPSVFATPRTVL